MKMEISARDKKLLVYLLAVVIIAGAYYFAGRPFMDKNAENTDKITQLQMELNSLNAIYNNSENYTQKIADEKLRIDEAMTKFPPGLTQERTLMMLQGIEDNTGAWINRVSFSEEEISNANPDAEGEGENEKVVIANGTAEVVEATPEPGNPADSENTVLSIGNIRNVAQDLSLDYYCSYKDFKKFLDYVKNYDERLFIANLNATYSVDTNAVSGSIVLRQYAIYGTGKELEAPDLSGINLGTDNIFTTLTGTGNMDLRVETVSEEEESTEEESSEEESSEEDSEDEESDNAEEESRRR